MIILAAPPFLVNQALVQALIVSGAHSIFSVLVQWVLTLGYEVRYGFCGQQRRVELQWRHVEGGF